MVAGLALLPIVAVRAAPASAQLPEALHAHAELGLGGWSGDPTLYGSMGLGLSSSWIGLTLSPLAWLMRPGEGEGNYVSTNRPEGKVCVDKRSGATYPDSFCGLLDATAIWTPNAELHLSAVRWGLPLWFGVGAREGTDDLLTWSVSYLHRSRDDRRIRVRALYSRDAWHLGVGLVLGGGHPPAETPG